MDMAEFLVVTVAGRPFGIATAEVKTAVPAQPVTPLPFVPDFVDGLVNINERIVPQLDLARLLGTPADAGACAGELVLVDTSRSPCALRVAQILGKAEVAAEALLPLADAGDEPAPVRCRFEWQGTSALVLDVERIGALIGARPLPDGERGLLGRLQADSAGTAETERLECVLVEVGGERHALALTDVVEILDLPEATPVPGAPPGVEGLAMVRDEVLLVLSLAALLGVPAAPVPGANVVVVAREDTRYGLRVDALAGLEQLEASRLRRLEDVTAGLEGVLATGDRLYGLLTPERLLPPERHRLLQALAPRRQAQAAAQPERQHAVLQVALGEELFGIALEQVKRIVEYHAPEPVQAERGSLVAGAVNIEGRVVPVVDLGARLRAGAGNDGAWVIVGTAGSEWAIAVREAADIVSIPDSALEPVQSGDDGFVHAIATVQDRLLSLLTLAPLLRGEA